MLYVPRDAIAELMRARRPGYTLPAGLYTRQDVFEADVEAIFHGHWIASASNADVPEPGDVYAVDVGRSSIAILRDDDGTVRAFHNVCSHRGARLLPAGRGTVGKLVCPYHQWTYELTASSSTPTHMGRDFDRGRHSLKPVHLRPRRRHPLHLPVAHDPPDDFDTLAATMEPYLAPTTLRDAKVAFADGHRRGRQLEAHDGEQPRVLSLRGEPSRADACPSIDSGFRLRPGEPVAGGPARRPIGIGCIVRRARAPAGKRRACPPRRIDHPAGARPASAPSA